ncbi:metal-dependent transcriptional regulator [Desulforegula conservatrix]|uniref:metal-dependent transcriptional regulator n=1 Tax=Desulforegula conservatrix TaxID=153026 RepID=UPI0004070B6B|nr:metal-dependent transcriptional regulator [Desulforegula conservatrix]
MIPTTEPAAKTLTSVMEDYLETIFNLEIDKKVVRVKDIAGRLKVKMPSVTSMLKTLSERGLVNYEKYEYVFLTDEGSAIGKEINRKHKILFKFLTDILHVDPAKAGDEACKMEHVLSHDTMDRLMSLMTTMLECPDFVKKADMRMKIDI